MIVEYVDLLKSSYIDSFLCYDKLQLPRWLGSEFVGSQRSLWFILETGSQRSLWSSAIWGLLSEKKIISKLSGRDSAATRRHLDRTNLGLWRSCSAGETSLWEGEIKVVVITNDPLIERGSISINIFTNTISSQTLVHLLYPIFISKPQIGTCGLLVVLITPCSWC